MRSPTLVVAAGLCGAVAIAHVVYGVNGGITSRNDLRLLLVAAAVAGAALAGWAALRPGRPAWPAFAGVALMCAPFVVTWPAALTSYAGILPMAALLAATGLLVFSTWHRPNPS